ncbi:MAG TPA: hypothetical protein VIX17_16135 [Pyrinomonadaceae bacterium]|jgi:hypothetical protein
MTIVLGPQASSPARVEKKQAEAVDENRLALFDAGRRGRLRSQDDGH